MSALGVEDWGTHQGDVEAVVQWLAGNIGAWRDASPQRMRELADACRMLGAEFSDCAAAPALPISKLERLRDLHARRDG